MANQSKDKKKRKQELFSCFRFLCSFISFLQRRRSYARISLIMMDFFSYSFTSAP